ncbi:MAG: hypothetical protein WCK70_02840 [Chloroflexales bacterium]
MNTRTISIGIIGGILIALALTLPWYFVLPSAYTTVWPAVPSEMGLIGYVLACLLTLAAGYCGPRWGWATTARSKVGLGAVTGLTATVVAWLLIGSATAGVLGQDSLLRYGLRSAEEHQMLILLAEAIVRTVWFMHLTFWAMAVAGGVLGAVGGAVYALHGAKVWGRPPRPTHPTIWLAVSMTTFLVAIVSMSVTLGIYALLEQKVHQVVAREHYHAILPTEGISLLPSLTLLGVVCVTIWLNWHHVALRRMHPILRLRRNIRPVIAITVVLSLLLVLLSALIDPQFVVQTFWIAVVGPIAMNVIGAYTTFRRTATPRQQDEPLPISGKDWLDYVLLAWLFGASFIVVGVTGVALAIVTIAIPYIGPLSGVLIDPVTHIEYSNEQIIRDAFLWPIGFNLIIMSAIVLSVPLFILYRYIYQRVTKQIDQSDEVREAIRLMQSCTTVAEISAIHHALGERAGHDTTSAIVRSFCRISLDSEAARQQQSSFNQRLALHAVEATLDTFTADLIRSGDDYATNFAPVAQGWRTVVATYLLDLTTEVEARQEIDSPYIIGVPLTAQQEIFIGRSDISTRIEHLLLDRRRPPLLLYGQRRMGKTSLLNNMGRLLPSTIVPLFVDLQGPASRSNDHAGLLYYLSRSMIESARQHRQLQLPPLARETLDRDPFGIFDEWLSEVEKSLGDASGLLMLDEFEVLDTAISRGRFDEESVLGTLRHIIQHRPRFKILLAGSHTLEEFRRWSSYLINVQVVQIGYLQEAETIQLIERPIKDFALRYEPEASQRILALTRGHPFLVQLLCAEVVALKNTHEPAIRRLARLADVEAALPEALASGDMFFADIARNQIDARGLALLRWIAAHREGEIMERESLLQHEPDLDVVLRPLMQRDLIEVADGGYRFQVELIRRWFAQESGTL